jgi:dienelactone hydrolase
MRSLWVKPLDWFSIQLARLSVQTGVGDAGRLGEAVALLQRPDFFCDFVQAPADFEFTSAREFRFGSPVPSPWPENNVVRGRLYCAGQPWQQRPTVVLLHGWNAERGYRVLFPFLAWRLARAGLNAAMIELPYHAQRKPAAPGAVRNFLSDDLVRVVEAMRQSVADARALVAWLEQQGCRSVGVWGVSLGGWLAGMLACVDARVRFAVLVTPVARMDRVVEQLDFCEPLRRGLNGARVGLERLNLASHRLRLSAGDVLVVASEHDLFAPLATVEELVRVWGGVECWRVAHGHISVLMSVPVMEATVRWMACRARSVVAGSATGRWAEVSESTSSLWRHYADQQTDQ